MLLLPATGYCEIDEITRDDAWKSEENIRRFRRRYRDRSSQQIECQGINSIARRRQPGSQRAVRYRVGPADTRITIRGLSNTRGRSNVAFLVDGIDVTTENLNAAGSGLLANRRLLSDVERIEVIKGPQSALYGRAAFSGAISYITKNPGDEFEGKVNMELGDYGEQQFGVALGGPVIDGVLGMRFTSIWYANDGYYTNSLSGEPLSDVDGEGYALTTVYTPTDELRFKLRGEYSKEDTGPLPNIRVGGGRAGYNLELFEYPEEALAAGLGQNAQYIPAVYNNGTPGWDVTNTSTSTALINFGQFCPPRTPGSVEGPRALPAHELRQPVAARSSPRTPTRSPARTSRAPPWRPSAWPWRPASTSAWARSRPTRASPTSRAPTPTTRTGSPCSSAPSCPTRW